MQGWSSFCRMLDKYVNIVDYSRWLSTISTKAPFQPSMEKQSSAATVKSKSSNHSVPKSGKMEPCSDSIYQDISQGSVRHSPSIKKQWLIKNHEVAKLNYYL